MSVGLNSGELLLAPVWNIACCKQLHKVPLRPLQTIWSVLPLSTRRFLFVSFFFNCSRKDESERQLQANHGQRESTVQYHAEGTLHELQPFRHYSPNSALEHKVHSHRGLLSYFYQLILHFCSLIFRSFLCFTLCSLYNFSSVITCVCLWILSCYAP